MSYGMRVWSATGVLQFDSTSTDRMQMVVDPISLAPGASSVTTYPELAGATVFAQPLIASPYSLTGGAASEPVVDYDLGYPRVTIPARGYTQFVVVYVK